LASRLQTAKTASNDHYAGLSRLCWRHHIL
jgi:hypothetical protein